MSHVWRSILWWLTGKSSPAKATESRPRDGDVAREVQRLLGSADFRALTALPPIPLTLWPGQAFMLLAQLQLVLRHPNNNGPSAEFVERLARKIQGHLSVNPTLTALCQKGWDPEFDVPI